MAFGEQMPKQKLYEDELTEALSAILKERRMLLGLSQDDVAAKTGMHRSYICDLERIPRNVSLKNLSRLAEALGISPSKLVATAERLVEENRRRR
jgi:transcriptional regulator with XRE-family HTH domain